MKKDPKGELVGGVAARLDPDDPDAEHLIEMMRSGNEGARTHAMIRMIVKGSSLRAAELAKEGKTADATEMLAAVLSALAMGVSDSIGPLEHDDQVRAAVEFFGMTNEALESNPDICPAILEHIEDAIDDDDEDGDGEKVEPARSVN